MAQATPATGLPKIPRWRAPKLDGIAHVYPSRSTVQPALCGAKNQEERFDHPRGRRCPFCAAKVGQA